MMENDVPSLESPHKRRSTPLPDNKKILLVENRECGIDDEEWSRGKVEIGIEIMTEGVEIGKGEGKRRNMRWSTGSIVNCS